MAWRVIEAKESPPEEVMFPAMSQRSMGACRIGRGQGQGRAVISHLGHSKQPWSWDPAGQGAMGGTGPDSTELGALYHRHKE